MEILRHREALQDWAQGERCAGRRIALVPTMGALHAGHLALVEEGRRRADRVVVSIYVNPTQFGPNEDLAAYPRPVETDLARCRAAGADAVFLPDDGELYPEGAQTRVTVSELARPLCGQSRPEHFGGVATVVTKLLIAARPHVAVFGEKDFQQLALVRRLVRDLGFAVDVVGVPTVREPDGVALSSRNAYLDVSTRGQAPVLVRALEAAEGALAAGERRAASLRAIVAAEIAKAPSAEIDYVELCDPASLLPAPDPIAAPVLLALAVHFRVGEGADARRVRLIDNRVLRPPQPPSLEVPS